MLRTKTAGIAKFIAKIEGRELNTVSIKLINPVRFPREVTNLAKFKILCREIAVGGYRPGQTIESFLLPYVDSAFIWGTTPYEDLFGELYDTGYLHEETFDCLVSWYQQMENGIMPGDDEYDDLSY